MSHSGFLNILKPPGMTSHDVVAFVRKRYPRGTKVGHLGTLDPAAAGVLPLAVGRATKLIPLLPNLGSSMKSYLAHLQLGLSTSTDDLEGETLTRGDEAEIAAITREKVEQALHRFRGKSSQVPPQVSAVRQDGKRAYERVRQGQEVSLKAREVTVEQLDLLDFEEGRAFLKVFMVCGSGTYVRSLARDLGEVLGVGGALAFLLRTHSGPFHLEDGISLEEFADGPLDQHLMSCAFPFSGLPTYTGEPLLQRGQRVAGALPTSGLLLAPDGLLRCVDSEPGVAVVEALFGPAL